MTRSPLLASEMLHLSRAPRTWALRFGFVLVLASAAALAWPWSGSALDVHRAGTILFQIFFWTELVAGVVLVPAMVAPAIAWERERATLDLLSVAPVTDFDIVSGKLLANGALTAATLAAGLPIGITALAMGGTTPAVFLASVVGILLNGAFAASVSVLMSAASDRAGTATGLALVTLMAFIFGSAFLGSVSGASLSRIDVDLGRATFALLCPWRVTIGEAVTAKSLGWVNRGMAWGAHVAESGAALAIAAIVLRQARSPRGRSPFRPVEAPAASAIPMAFFPNQPAAPAPVTMAPWPAKSYRLPIRGNPVYWKDRAFDDSTGRQILMLLGTLSCLASFGIHGLVMLGQLLSPKSSSLAAGSYTLAFDLLVCLVLAIGAGASTLGPERRNGTLPLLVSTGFPVREILRGKLLAALRSIAPALVVGGLHACLAAATLGAWGPLALAAPGAALALAFLLACVASLVFGDPRRAAATATVVLFLLWAAPSLAALPYRGHAVLLTSLNPFGILLRSVSAASDGVLRMPSLAAAIPFVAVSAAAAASCLAGAAAALEARIRA